MSDAPTAPTITIPGKMLVDKPQLTVEESMGNLVNLARGSGTGGKTVAEAGTLWRVIETSIANVQQALADGETLKANAEALEADNAKLRSQLEALAAKVVDPEAPEQETAPAAE